MACHNVTAYNSTSLAVNGVLPSRLSMNRGMVENVRSGTRSALSPSRLLTDSRRNPCLARTAADIRAASSYFHGHYRSYPGGHPT